ncbi:hypothetical protein [Clostridium sp.]|uniref:hypothetical protein n=1 Tax=Clostridium TaxID=1485 RepID=UPI00206742A5|nr:hypothetical protein [Clostridium sp.]MDU7260740.1 hypothetical protein [Clostridium butyricum]DAT56640.1 MAG TPA: hypothetical protein [Caudoviricetes sp.]MDU1068192.1 hypothetical protein [Clostridium sp.]MDU2679766.1 hypothetical protein [Clostridium sp.]MDU4211947.1 hypothetical protein [Clostridium sp.]
MLSYYINRGHKLDYLLNLTYCERMFFISSMLQENEERIDENIALNPFIEKK